MIIKLMINNTSEEKAGIKKKDKQLNFKRRISSQYIALSCNYFHNYKGYDILA